MTGPVEIIPLEPKKIIKRTDGKASMKLTGLGQYSKFLVAIAGQALIYAQYTYGSSNKWVELATAAAVALGVFAVPNTPKAAPPPVAPPP